MTTAPGVILEHSYMLTAIGRDRIGFLASFCADRDINILDLSTVYRRDVYTTYPGSKIYRRTSILTDVDISSILQNRIVVEQVRSGL